MTALERACGRLRDGAAREAVLAGCARRAHEADRGGDEDEREHTLGGRKNLGKAALGQAARHALAEIEQREHRRPLIGAPPSGHNPGQGQRERRRLEGKEGSARTKRREDELPGERERDQRKQRRRRDRAQESRR